jgi:hypothetical protein
MFKKLLSYCFALLFLTGSLIFPLGDLSLMRDIPKMYQNYTAVTSGEEADAIDFIGDYLLHGKDLLGHNEHDKTPAKGSEIQFQHQANLTNVIFGHVHQFLFPVSVIRLSHPPFGRVFYLSNCQNTVFRPPLV